MQLFLTKSMNESNKVVKMARIFYIEIAIL